MRQLNEPEQEREYDLRYLSPLTPKEIRARLAEKTVPYHPRKAPSNPLLLHPQENGGFYLVSTGHHYFIDTFGIALLHLEPQSDTGDTVIKGNWQKEVPMKRPLRDVLILALLVALLVLVQIIFPMDIHALIRGGLGGIAGSLSTKVIVHFTAPKYRVVEQKKLQTFIETNLLD